MDTKNKYAIIQSGAKQYRVMPGDKINVELLDLEAGSAVEFKEVLFMNDASHEVGAPSLPKWVVRGKVIGEAKGPKITFMKYRPSHNERRKHGHRQKYTQVEITEFQTAK